MLYVLAAAAVGLTSTMFLSRSSMLGFPCAMFWALFGGYCYQQSITTWDIYFLTAFASLLGMTVFSMLAANGLKTKKEELAEGDELIDEADDDEPVSARRKMVRSRAELRRS